MKKITAVLTAMLMLSSTLVGCTDKEKRDDSDDSSSVSVNEDELAANPESDFIWHVITADEVASSQYVGGIVITSYVGESENVVIPKTIDNKPVVAIGEFAFSPSSLDDWYYSDYEYSDSYGYEPVRAMVDYLGLSEKYERLDAEATAEMEKLGISYRDIDRYRDEWDMYFNNEKDLSVLIEKFKEIGKSDIAQYLEKYTYNEHCYFNRDRDEDDENIASAYIAGRSRYMQEIISALEEAPEQSDLKSVLIPDSVSLIGSAAFAFCDSLEKVLIYGADKGDIPIISSGVWTDINGGDEGDFIQGYQFFACTSLKETNLYFDVDGYGSQCYDYCIGLEKVYLYPTEEGDLNFSYCIPHSYKISDVIIADGTTKIYKYDDEMAYPFKECTFYVPASVTEQGKHSICQHNYYESGGTDVSEGMPCNYDDVSILTPAGSYAEQYAKEKGIKYISE